jgi:hypothetical protein
MCSGLLAVAVAAHSWTMGGPSKERTSGETIRQADQRARETRHVADIAACEAWNYRMEGYGGPAQPSPPIGGALNAGFRYLEIKCAGCTMHSTVDLTTLRRPRETPIWQIERRMRSRKCSEFTSAFGAITDMAGLAVNRQRHGSELRRVGAELVKRHRDGDHGARPHLDVVRSRSW